MLSSRTESVRRLPAIVRLLRREVSRVREPVLNRVKRETRDPFRVLIACVISLRTKDAVTDAASRKLFALARTPRRMLALSAVRIGRAIYPAGFYRTKARQIRGICRAILERHGGRTPSGEEDLLALPGVGRKTMNLVRGEGFGLPAICVDVHVHRISNRLGLIRTRDPEETEYALAKLLPRRLWTEWNALLVPFGQHVCHPTSPWCSRCSLRAGQCARRGVLHSR